VRLVRAWSLRQPGQHTMGSEGTILSYNFTMALVAHGRMKEVPADFVRNHRTALELFHLVATNRASAEARIYFLQYSPNRNPIAARPRGFVARAHDLEHVGA
jgi:hypothetical protein